MANLLYSEPAELTLSEFKKLTGWSFPRIARELGQDERTLYERVKKDDKDTPHYTTWRKHLALIYRVYRFECDRATKDNKDTPRYTLRGGDI